MKIRSLLIIITTAIVILSMVTLTLVAVLTIKKQGQDDIEKYKAEELAKVRHNLKILAYMAYGIVEKNDKTVKGQVNFPMPGPELFSTLGFSGERI